MNLKPQQINHLYPIVGVRLFPMGLEILRRAPWKRLTSHVGQVAQRKSVKQLTKKSLSRLAFLGRNYPYPLVSLMTLTYPASYPTDGRETKSHLDKMLKFLRRELEDLHYLWFMEFQQRGAPHYHIALSHFPTNGLRYIAARRWSDIVADRVNYSSLSTRKTMNMWEQTFLRHLEPDHWEPIREKEGLARYITKYASKPEQKVVPEDYSNCGRFWGSDVALEDIEDIRTIDGSHQELTEFVQIYRPELSSYEVLPRYIWTKALE